MRLIRTHQTILIQLIFPAEQPPTMLVQLWLVLMLIYKQYTCQSKDIIVSARCKFSIHM